MKIAVTYQDGEIFQHFGKSEQFKVYKVENNQVSSADVIGTGEKGHGSLAGLLKENGVDSLICGGIGEGAKQALEKEGIKLYAGVSGAADEAATALIAGRLAYNPDVQCGHHGNKEGHGHGESGHKHHS